MKILLSAYACEPNKGSEPEVGWRWALELSKIGYEVWVITRANNQSSIDGEFSKRNRPKKLHFIYYDLPSWICRLKKGNRFVYIYYLLWQWGAYKKAKAAHARLQFDLVHHVTFVSVRQPSFMGNLGIPFIFGPAAGGESAPWRLRLHYGIKGLVIDAIRDLANFFIRLDPLMWRTFYQAKKIYVTSEQTKNLVPYRYHHKTNIKLAIGIDPIKAPELSKKTNMITPRILYVGHFVYLKGMALGLRAFADLLSHAPNATLTMVGKGPDETKLRRLAKKLNISNHITWIPWIGKEHLSGIYEQHDIFLFPSLHDSGGLVVLEAMAHGLPVICLDIGGPGYLITDSCGTKINASGKPAKEIIYELSKSIALMISEPDFFHLLRQGALNRVCNFSWDLITNSFYNKALS